MKKNNKYLINIIVIVVIFMALFVYMVIVDGLANMISTIKSVDPLWIAAGLGCMLIYWLLEALVLNVLCKKIYPEQKYFNSFKITMIGQLFNNITPFSSGGQPIQAVIMAKEGKSMGNSATILLIKFIVFQAVHVLYTLVVLIFKFTYFRNLISNFADLALIGFTVNSAVIIALIAVGINQNLAFVILKPIYKLLGKFGIMKDIDNRLIKLRHDVDEFHGKFKVMKSEKVAILKATFYTVLQVTAFFTVAYTVYRAFGFNGNEFINILCAQAFLTMIMAFVPTPGAGGVAEGGFYIIFLKFFSVQTINMAIMFWRIYTFYIPILVGGLFILAIKHHNSVDGTDYKLLEEVEQLKEHSIEE